ncbi:hypothetical protein COX05_00820 [candidate division WWE3 bacterium CG22_combo_CG10-13_8_21_14_all_39_12]|uniref:Pseudouridine synthase n=2 Tax=Katanobacteria TaxID=422282 RepID=A0A2M7X4V6_UNCKA|nr:MAG: hypothetical protein COX05_00820 [candidate division WWE3 bacterium CG22_combo_CG10-13_8_21_14_all_39_12]PJA41167.1 MAG: hypothetical protein CO179_00475 [candidate division WWE3 bacterium CG_4_9_14_3_um_filter_39_7]
MRIAKYFSQQKIASRREAEEYLKKGQVTVNGEVVKDMGRQIDPDKDVVEIIGKMVSKTTIAYFKPRGISSSTIEEEGTNVFDVLPQYESLNTVGRLDKQSEGLILLTDDGVLASIITSDKHIIEKEYRVTVREIINPKQLLFLEKGVFLEDGLTLPVSIEIIDEHTFTIVMKEGRKHQIRRMANAVNLTIENLTRTRIGPITLDKLKEGSYRTLKLDEVQRLIDTAPIP